MKKQFILTILALIILSSICFSENSVSDWKDETTSATQCKPSENLKKPSPFSIQMHCLGGSFENYKKAINQAKELGVSQVRDELFWHVVEKEKGVYHIPEEYLQKLDYAISQGIDTLIILNYGNKLYEDGNAPSKEETFKAFAEYAYTMAKELKGRVHYFEVWNEPNIDGFWRPSSNPKDYAKLLKYTYPAVKKGNPDATVISFALSGVSEEYVNAVLDEGAYPFMDKISFHPYCSPAAPETAGKIDTIKKQYENFKKYGEQKPIWITEVGWPTNKGGGVVEERQADYTVRHYLLDLSLPFIETTFIYWMGPDGDDELWAEDRFGLLHKDSSPKPSFTAVQNMIRVLKDYKFDKAIIDDNVKVFQFSDKDKKCITAIWTVEGSAEIIINTESLLMIVLRDGMEKTLAPHDGKITIRANSSPVYIKSNSPLTGCKVSKSETYKTLFRDKTNSLPIGMSKALTFASADGKEVKGTLECIPQDEKIVTVVKGETLSSSGQMLSASKSVHPCESDVFSFFTFEGNKEPSIFISERLGIYEPTDIKIAPIFPEDAKKTFSVEIFNRTDKEISGILNVEASLYFKEESKDNKTELNLSSPRIYFKNIQPAKSEKFTINISSEINPDTIVLIKARTDIEGITSVYAERKISFYTSHKAASEIKIDGDLSEWSKKQQPINIRYKSQKSGGYVEWEGEKDSSSQVYITWDDKYLYFGIEQQDDIYADTISGFGIYNNDGIEVYMDTDYEKDFKDNYYSKDDHQYGLFPSLGKDIVFGFSQLGKESKNSRIKINRSPEKDKTISGRDFKGMIIEAAIPLEEIGLKITDKKMMGMNVAFTDDDDPNSVHPFYQDLQMSWTAGRNSYQSPHVFAFIFFSEKR